MAVTINGSTGVQLDDDDKQEFGTGDDLKIYHSATGNKSYITHSGAGAFDIASTGDNLVLKSSEDIYLMPNDSENGIYVGKNGSVKIYHDNVLRAETTANGFQAHGNLTIRDNVVFYIGDGNDLQISHNGSDSIISNATGSLDIQSAGNINIGKSGENGIKVKPDNTVELYYDNNKSLETSTPGIRVGMSSWGSDPSSSNSGMALYSTGSGGINSSAGGTGDSDHALFMNPNGVVGRIRTNGSGTSFNTSSDYRLKENQVSISDGITRLKQLKPYRFNFKSDASTTVDGFFAHEVTPTVPEAITGEKDAVELADNDKRGIKKGDIIAQGIDQSKLVPLLTAALQEAITKIETLETEVNTLKTKVAALEAHTHE